jgi:hypothetical protein
MDDSLTAAFHDWPVVRVHQLQKVVPGARPFGR